LQIRVLGCFGGSAPDQRPTSFLINENVAIDAGALTSGLNLKEQAAISHIFFSHSHIDHLFTLPFLLDNIFESIREPIKIHGPEHTIMSLKSYLFNNHLWPDFTSITNKKSSLMELAPLKPGDQVIIDNLKITPALMDHTVECFGYLIESKQGSAFIFGDTCSVDNALPYLKKASNLKVIVLEASFPNRMEKIAKLSRHLTSNLFKNEVDKLPKHTRILVTHMKPDCLGEIQIEIASLALDNVSLIEQGAVYDLGRL